MSILDKLLPKSEPQITVVEKYVQNVVNTVMGLDPAELYETQDALRAVVDFIADSIASCPLKVYVRNSDNDRVRDTDSIVAKLLKAPNSHMTTYDFTISLVQLFMSYHFTTML